MTTERSETMKLSRVLGFVCAVSLLFGSAIEAKATPVPKPKKRFYVACLCSGLNPEDFKGWLFQIKSMERDSDSRILLRPTDSAHEYMDPREALDGSEKGYDTLKEAQARANETDDLADRYEYLTEAPFVREKPSWAPRSCKGYPMKEDTDFKRAATDGFDKDKFAVLVRFPLAEESISRIQVTNDAMPGDDVDGRLDSCRVLEVVGSSESHIDAVKSPDWKPPVRLKNSLDLPAPDVSPVPPVLAPLGPLF